MLDLKPPVCNVTFSTQDLVCSPILSVEDEGKKPSTSMVKFVWIVTNFILRIIFASRLCRK